MINGKADAVNSSLLTLYLYKTTSCSPVVDVYSLTNSEANAVEVASRRGVVKDRFTHVTTTIQVRTVLRVGCEGEGREEMCKVIMVKMKKGRVGIGFIDMRVIMNYLQRGLW